MAEWKGTIVIPPGVRRTAHRLVSGGVTAIAITRIRK